MILYVYSFLIYLMKLNSSIELPKLGNRESTRLAPPGMAVPFEKVIKKLKLNHTLRRVTYGNKNIRKSQEIYVPSNIKSWDDNSLQELNPKSNGKIDAYKQRYLSILSVNPQAFHKAIGEFTLYSDCSVRINSVGPYNRKKQQ